MHKFCAVFKPLGYPVGTESVDFTSDDCLVTDTSNMVTSFENDIEDEVNGKVTIGQKRSASEMEGMNIERYVATVFSNCKKGTAI